MQIQGFLCDNPKCKKGQNESRLEVIWDVRTAEEHPEVMPDVFYKFIVRRRVYEEPGSGRSKTSVERHFCSIDCEREFIRDEVPPLSPREQYVITENNKRVDEERQKEIASREAAKK